VKQAVHRYSFFGKVEEIADKRRHAFNQKLAKAEGKLQHTEEDLKVVKRAGGSTLEVENEEQVVYFAKSKRDRLKRKRDFWRDRFTWAHARHSHWGTVLKHRRDRLRRWVQQHDGFQPYMANGHPYEAFTEEGLYGIYLDFRRGLYVTATYEGHPGDGVHSTTSGHYLQNQPDGRARCWDAGASTRGPMAAAQKAEAERCPSYLIELLGPINDEEFKNGVRYTLPEGDPLEEMHDNHKHTWLRDGAPTR
jgi:hypothetical protein